MLVCTITERRRRRRRRRGGKARDREIYKSSQEKYIVVVVVVVVVVVIVVVIVVAVTVVVQNITFPYDLQTVLHVFLQSLYLFILFVVVDKNICFSSFLCPSFRRAVSLVSQECPWSVPGIVPRFCLMLVFGSRFQIFQLVVIDWICYGVSWLGFPLTYIFLIQCFSQIYLVTLSSCPSFPFRRLWKCFFLSIYFFPSLVSIF